MRGVRHGCVMHVLLLPCAAGPKTCAKANLDIFDNDCMVRGKAKIFTKLLFWDPSFPLESTKQPPPPRKSRKITQKSQYGSLSASSGSLGWGEIFGFSKGKLGSQLLSTKFGATPPPEQQNESVGVRNKQVLKAHTFGWWDPCCLDTSRTSNTLYFPNMP